MNRQGEYTDWQGKVLQHGDEIELIKDISDAYKGARGTILRLPDRNSDWYGYMRVIIPLDNYRRVWAMDVQTKFVARHPSEGVKL